MTAWRGPVLRSPLAAAGRAGALACLTAVAVGVLGPGPVSAQQTGTLVVSVLRPDSTPLAGAFVRSDRVGGVADPSGVARIELPARLVRVEVSHPGFRPRLFEITILPAVVQRHELTLEPRDGSSADVLIEATRATRRPDQEAAPVVVIGSRELARRGLARPADLTTVFLGEPGLRLQAQIGPLDANRFRADGIRGQYTGVLVDGLPLLGGYAGGFGAMQLSPLEFDQIEWLRGPTSALYGPLAAGGVLNLVSRRADRNQLRIGVNQNSEKGGDLSVWGARRLTPTLGATLFADFHQQRLVDADDDNWGEIPRAIRFAIRPRLHFDQPNGDGVMVTAGATSEDRTGGFLFSNTGGDPYREERRTRRFDGAVSGRRMVGATGLLQFKFAAAFQSISHRFDDLRERDRRSSLFSEATYRRTAGRLSILAGLGWYREALRQRDFAAFDFTHSAPSAFGSASWSPTDRMTATVAGRCDRHNVHGSQCQPRLDLLVRPSARVEMRAFGALGYTTPTPLSDDVETIGLHATFPIATKSERLAGGGLDVRWRSAATELGAAATYTRVALPLRLVPLIGDTADRLRLLNVAEPTRVLAIDLRASHQRAPFLLGAYYAFRNGTEGVPAGTGRRDLDLTPSHRIGFNLGWRAPRGAGTAVDADFSFVGRQPLADNVFRTSAPSYSLLNGLVSQRSGRARLYFSAENVLDVRLRDYEPVFFDPILGGRRTNAPWVPLRGRVISLGAMVEW